MSKRLGGVLLGCTYKISSPVVLIVIVTLGQQYNVGEKCCTRPVFHFSSVQYEQPRGKALGDEGRLALPDFLVCSLFPVQLTPIIYYRRIDLLVG